MVIAVPGDSAVEHRNGPLAVQSSHKSHYDLSRALGTRRRVEATDSVNYYQPQINSLFVAK